MVSQVKSKDSKGRNPIWENLYYVYRHVRLDTGEVFYVGMGKKKLRGRSFKRLYSRAFFKKKRTIIWSNIQAKTDYIVEILFESNSLEEIRLKEIEFIKLYGRRDLNQGTLVNFCDGGGGSHNRIGKKGKDNPSSKEVFVYLKNGDFYKKFDSQTDAVSELGVCRDIAKVLRGELQWLKGYVFKSSYLGEKIDCGIKPHSKIRGIDCFDMDLNFIKSFPSVTEAAKFFNVARTNVSQACKSLNRHCKGHRFSYRDFKTLELYSD